MANVSRINGFKPVMHLGGAPYNGRVTMYSIDATDATAIGIGDLVKMDGTTHSSGIRQVTRATTTGLAVGAVVGFKVDATALNTPQYRTASTQRYVFVADDPTLIFEAQADAAVTAANAGQNYEVTIAAASTITGMSAMQVDADTNATTATLLLKMLDFVQREDNEVAATSNKVLVMINAHQLGQGTGAAGI